MAIALFDFDGTITNRDTFTLFIKDAIPRYRLLIGYSTLWPLIIGYKYGLVAGTTLRKNIIRIGFTGLNIGQLKVKGEKFANNVIPNLIRPIAIKKIEWHRDQGHKIVVVSASLDLYLEPWCQKNGLDLVSSKLEIVSSKSNGRYLQGDCTSEEKSRRVKSIYDLDSYEKIFAYGDSREDRELLDLADVSYYRWEKIKDV